MTDSMFDAEFASVEDYAREFRRLGFQVVPSLPPKAGEQWKRPAIKWRELENILADDGQFEEWFSGYRGSNIGIVTGRASGNRLVIDIDRQKGASALQWWHGLMAVHNNGSDLGSETVAQHTGGGGLQYIFSYPEGYKAPTCKTSIGVDIRGEGGFAVMLPSKHESGASYTPLDGQAPWEIDVAMAPDWLLAAITQLAVEHGGGAVTQSVRTQTPGHSRTLSGRIKDGREHYMTQLVWAAILDMYEESPIKCESALRAERDEAYVRYASNVVPRLNESRKADDELLELEGRGRSLFNSKWQAATELWDTKIREAVAARKTAPSPFLLEVMDPETGEITEIEIPKTEKAQESSPAIIGEGSPLTNVYDPWERFPVPAFPLDALNPAIRNYVRDCAASVGGDISACAMTALSVCGAAIDQSLRLKMRRSGTWSVPPLIWVMLFGDPSTKKTPILKSFLWPLERIEADARREHQKDIARWKAAGGPKSDEDEPSKPVRYITSDATVEKIADILSRQDRGLLMHKDEMSGWFAAIDGSKNGRDAEKSFWTKAYNAQSHSVDRILRGETFVSNLAVSVIGGMQPDEMAKIPDLSTNGLMQRFIPVVMRDAIKGREVDDAESSQQWNNLIRYLAGLAPHGVIASDEALAVFDAFQDECLAMEQVKGLGSKFTTFVGKLPGMHGSLSLILHLIDGNWDTPLTRDAAMRSAKILRDFAMPHAMAFYGASTDGTDMDEIRSVASYVLSSDKDRFVPNDFARASRTLRNISMWEMAKRISPLVVNGWLEEEASKTTGVRAWLMRPGIREALFKRRQEQQDQRKKVATMLATWRQQR